MDYVHFIAGQDDKGRRLDRILRRILPENSLSGLYKSLRNGLIKVDGKKQKPEFHVSEGSDISVAAFLITPESSGQNSKDAENSFIDEKLVVFRNKYLLILNKPYDVNVQKAFKNENSLDEMVKKDFEARGLNKESLSFKTGPLHRLDKKTTGLIAFSQNLEGARWFSKAIMSHETKKTYLALVQGKMTEYENWQDEIEKNYEKRGYFYYQGFSISTDMLEPYEELDVINIPVKDEYLKDSHEEKQEKEISYLEKEWGIKDNMLYGIIYESEQTGERKFFGEIVNFNPYQVFIIDDKMGLAILRVSNIISMIPIKEREKN